MAILEGTPSCFKLQPVTTKSVSIMQTPLLVLPPPAVGGPPIAEG